MKIYSITMFAILCFGTLQAQVGIGTTTPSANAVLEVASTTQGVAFPQLTTEQRNAIGSPAKGLTIFNTTTNVMETNAGTTSLPVWILWRKPNPSSNGTALVSAYTCTTASRGVMVTGTAVGGVTQTVTATVTTAGTYNISATANGVTFAGSGTFAGTGAQDIVLTATGTPTTADDTQAYDLNTTPNCSFNRAVAGHVVSTTGKTWMDRNLGATRVATSSNDAFSYGDLYQWGRLTDGHQIKTSVSIGTLSNTDVPGNANFIVSSFDWRSPQNDNLWQGVNGINNPCPTGYRLPTETEWEAERNNGGTGFWGTGSVQNNGAGAIASVLKLPMPGDRSPTNGFRYGLGTKGRYWSSTVSGTSVISMFFNADSALLNTTLRTQGFSVRCLQD
jgi:uncharacterized protein (TIGR02145 family)